MRDPDDGWEASLAQEGHEMAARQWDAERQREMRNPIRLLPTIAWGVIHGLRGYAMDPMHAALEAGEDCGFLACEYEPYHRAYNVVMAVVHPRTARDPQHQFMGMSRKEERDYEAHFAEEEAEHREFERTHRSICPKCGQRTVKHGDACTLGNPNHPEAEWSATYVCQNEDCDYATMA